MLLRTPGSLRVTGQGARAAEGAGRGTEGAGRGAEGADRGAELRAPGSLRASAVALS